MIDPQITAVNRSRLVKAKTCVRDQGKVKFRAGSAACEITDANAVVTYVLDSVSYHFFSE